MIGERHRGEPHSVPRGILKFYVLSLVKAKPSYGYDLIKTIEVETNYAWRPGPGSIYPLLKELVSKGLLEEKRGVKGGEGVVYRITREGERKLEEGRKAIRFAAKKLQVIGKIVADIAEPDALGEWCLQWCSSGFSLVQKVANMDQKLLSDEARIAILEKVRLNMISQVEWIDARLKEKTLEAKSG